jgi:antitoxin ParD1/3/4
MKVQQLSISLPAELCRLIEKYRLDHHLNSRSEVIIEALKLLQEKQLETYYLQANQEIDLAYDNTSGDGLDD